MDGASGSGAGRKRKDADASTERDADAGPSSSGGGGVRVLPKRSLAELLERCAPGEIVDPLVERFLMEVADDFVDSAVRFACKLAAHRKSDALEVKDIALHLERAWDMVIPGYDGEELREYRAPAEVVAHKRRMADVRRAVAAAAEQSKKADVPAAEGDAS